MHWNSCDYQKKLKESWIIVDIFALLMRINFYKEKKQMILCEWVTQAWWKYNVCIIRNLA